ncbi:hypothetical protein TIFTF001_030638 [Ficus carica]|uniref:CCHC-type domain-containing protein n=1 Tax=Ficus carica TaxID=3494 RepID=A0AA88J013_FICCA|nr:hypothetical protein TIFTF001_030638 [Ficus carica]
MKDALVQHGLLKGLQGNKSEKMSNEDWEELEARVMRVRVRVRPLGRYYEWRDDCSQSSSWKDFECFYCHVMGHSRRNCEELKRHLEERRKQKSQETEAANVVGDRYDSEDDVYDVTTEGADSDSRILDSGYLFHMCPLKECCEDIGKCYACSLTHEKFNFFGGLDTLGCECSAKSGFMKVKRGALVAMTGEKVKNQYNLIRKTVVGGAVTVEPCQKMPSSVAKQVARVK